MTPTTDGARPDYVCTFENQFAHGLLASEGSGCERLVSEERIEKMLEAAQRERPGYVFEVTDRKAMNCLE